ncbi:uncharacterized protein UTRI_04219_B [Ustilago trichophora]|uniref:G-protein coupled receptors family 1 profile domain-containing protein n=1 Tax=Ustilago trichophora TaxID=86804 RepID=A0A5C3EDN1_9BASI|nr:uncharacterized protein UTRI_04219_B [Ustilago trichophora]
MSHGSLYKAHPWWFHYDDPSVRVIAANNNSNANTNDTATFQRESVGTTGNTVDMVICCLSFVGALAIILPYVLNRRSRKLRHALILGLATSDLATSIVIIITTACLLANINLVQQRDPCTFLGYILVSSIFSQHLWNLSIAIVTYMILVHPLSSFTLTVEKRVRWLWPVFWSVSFAINAIPFGLGGFGFRGGYCAFTTSFYFASIFQFVPRAIVFIVILCLYTHLFFFLRRTNLFSKANNSNSISHSRHKSAHLQSKQQHSLNAQQSQLHEAGQPVEQPLLATTPFSDMLATPADDPTAKGPASSGPSSAAEHSRKTSSGSRVTPILAKNDPSIINGRRSSSLVEKDGSVEMATLDPSRRKNSLVDAASATPEEQADTSLSGLLSYSNHRREHDEDGSSDVTAAPLATYGLLDPNYSMASRRPMPSELDIEKANTPHYDTSSISPHSPSNSSYAGGGGAATLSTKGSSAPLNGSFPRGSADSLNARRVAAATANKRPFTAEAGSRGQFSNASGPNSVSAASNRARDQRRASLGDSRYAAANSSSDGESDESDEFGNRRMRPRKDAGDFDMMTPPVEHLKHYTAPMRNYARMADILAMDESEMQRARGGGGGGGGEQRRGSAVQILPGEVVVEMPSKEAFEEALGNDWNWGMDVTAGTHPNPRVRNGNAGLKETEAGLNTGTSSTSSADENGVESIGSTLNRQASLLLLLYPAAYCLLFSISIARLAVDLADPGASVRNTHDWLHSLSRWLIFAQGAIDALIFQFVERQFRQRMKRRRRKAMGEQVQDSFSHRVGKKAIGHVKKSWPSHASKTQTGLDPTCSHPKQHS